MKKADILELVEQSKDNHNRMTDVFTDKRSTPNILLIEAQEMVDYYKGLCEYLIHYNDKDYGEN